MQNVALHNIFSEFYYDLKDKTVAEILPKCSNFFFKIATKATNTKLKDKTPS